MALTPPSSTGHTAPCRVSTRVATVEIILDDKREKCRSPYSARWSGERSGRRYVRRTGCPRLASVMPLSVLRAARRVTVFSWDLAVKRPLLGQSLELRGAGGVESMS